MADGHPKRNQDVFLLPALICALFFALVLVMAFRPDWLSASVTADGVDAPALVITMALLVGTVGAMGVFCWFRGARK
jgi:uncharacterized membrane protein (DUF485 family)